MKKFCTECGHPLDIDKKFCSDCGTANPFYSLSFEFTAVRTNTMEKLRQKRLSIEKQLHQLEEEQQELLRKEQLRKEMEELEKQKVNRQEKEKAIKEKFEREEIEIIFKKELRQMKEEAETYKQQTTALLQELRHVIVQIDEENKRLKEEVEQMAQTKPVLMTPTPPADTATTDINTVTEGSPLDAEPVRDTATTAPTSRRWWWMLVVVIFVVANLWAYVRYFRKDASATQTATMSLPVTEPTSTALLQPQPITPSAHDETLTEPIDSVPAAMVNEPQPPAEQPWAPSQPSGAAAPPVKEEIHRPKPAFRLTASMAKKDLVGQRLSGCGITLKNANEVSSISNPVPIPTQAAEGYIKYKLSLKVTQDGESYKVSPYVYYSSAGKLLKIDASNCE